MHSPLDRENKRFEKNANIIRRDIADEIILVPIRGDLADMQRIFALDATSDFIWRQLDGRQSIGDIHTAVLNNFDVETDRAAADLNAFIGELLEADLITEVD